MNFQLPPPGRVIHQDTFINAMIPKPKVNEEFCLRSHLSLMEDKQEAEIRWAEYLLFYRPMMDAAERLTLIERVKHSIDSNRLLSDRIQMRRDDYENILRWQIS